MQPATRLNDMRESTIREMTRLAIAHEAINLSQGFPDFPAHPALKEAAIQAIRADQNQYAITWGIPALRQAIAAKMERRYNLHVDPDRHITVTCGVTEGIVSSLMAITNPGDEVIIIEPFHENFLPAVLFAGGTPVFFALEPPAYQLDAERLRRAFTSRTRAIIVNTPHNPTGRVFSREELQGVADLCHEFDALAITDEIYEHIIYDNGEHIPLATLPGMAERTITIGGMSKTFAITGWRLGIVVAQEPWSTALRTVHDFTTICAPTPLQHAAVTAMGFGEDYYRQMKEDYTSRRQVMLDTLQEVGFRAQPPQGAYYVMADFSPFHFDGDDHQFARWLTTEVGVAVVPGSSFYHTSGLGRHSVRFAFPKQLPTLEEAGRRLRQHLPM
ncbi:MAG: aminotransferase class I/II-fold pyridoxal phosphate-dependent enzyme [Chloroflexi bacterium]|nr:aminotransferase class I/II-fold pyridoxal phosphate-dependent enzyme [Chloroflexota bacterium]